MPYQLIDGGWAMHAKTRSVRSADALALWVIAGSMSTADGSGGLISADVVDLYCLLAFTDHDRAIPPLVAAGLWHDAKTLRKCRSLDKEGRTCRDTLGRNLKPGEFYVHHWADHNPTEGDGLAKARDLRRKALNRNLRLKDAVRARDMGLCRYCEGMVVEGADHKSPSSETFDHIDPYYELFGPTRGNTIDNVVLACRQCNGEKKDRTPDQWRAAGGRALLPEPDSGRIRVGSAPDSPDSEGADPTLARAHTRETGRIRIGAGSGSGSGPKVGSNGNGVKP